MPAPAVRNPTIDPATGRVVNSPVTGSINSPATAGSGAGRVATPDASGIINIGGPASQPALPSGVAGTVGVQPANRSSRVIASGDWRSGYQPGSFSRDPGNTGRYLVDEAGSFIEGDPSAYAREYAGLYPTGGIGSYTDPVSLAERNAAQNNYGAGLANLDLQENNTRSSFEELLGLLNRNKGKNLGSLADSMADRGLSNSGIFLGSTNEVNQNFAEQGAQQTRQRDSQLNEIQRGRTDMSNQLNQALAQADRLAYERRLQAYNDTYQAGLRQAQDALRAAGLIA